MLEEMANIILMDDVVDSKATHQFNSLFQDASVYTYEFLVDDVHKDYQVIEIRPTGNPPYLLGYNVPDKIKAEIARYSGLEFK